MSAFHQLINGNGIPSYFWCAVLFSGNTDFEEIAYGATYSSILPEKLRHPRKSDIVVELRWNAELIGDETEMLKLQERVNKVCIVQ